jgi:CxxC-x17-CxxC domain-containing protein
VYPILRDRQHPSRTARSVTDIDKMLTCRDCGRPFVFTAGEQAFYRSRGLLNEPGRCPECRAARKAQRTAGGYGTSGGDGAAGGYGDGDRPRRTLYAATCASCGRDARVPFQPRADKPVYCSDCFDAVRARR